MKIITNSCGICTVALFLLAVVSGCGSSGPPLGQITGVVTMDGKPVSDVSLSFMPAGEGRPSYAITDAEGRFEVMFVKDQKGALIGQHNVTFEKSSGMIEVSEDDEFKGPPSREKGGGDASVSGRKLSPETVDINAGSNSIDFELVAK